LCALFPFCAILGIGLATYLLKSADKEKLIGKLSILVSRDSANNVLSIEQHQLIGERSLVVDILGVAITNHERRNTMMWEDVDIMSVTQQYVFLRSDYIMVIPLRAFPRAKLFQEFIRLAIAGLLGV
jgi:hypothetical protein